MLFLNITDDTLGEEEELDDAEATLADDLLDEVGEEEEDTADMEGFGLIDEAAVVEEEEETDESGEKVEDAAALEEDAEEVDFDTFDDVDEL